MRRKGTGDKGYWIGHRDLTYGLCVHGSYLMLQSDDKFIVGNNLSNT